MTDGFDVLVQLVIAAITTEPFSTVASGLAATATVARPLMGPPSWVSREMASLRMPERRRVVFVLLSDKARTGDAHAAFLAGVNLVVNLSEAAGLPRALEKNMRDLNDLYRDFNKALGLAEL